MYVRDLEGNEYPLQATITNEYELNGNQNITLQIQPTPVNDLFIENISEMWEVVDHDDVTHKIIYCKKRGAGDKLTVNIKAVPLFFDEFDSDRIYEVYDESMTAQVCFNRIFQDTNYNVVLNGSFTSKQWQGFGGGDTRLSLFKDALNRYGAEFRIVGNTIYIENQIGRDTQFQYRYRLNASNIVQENDASKYYTYAKGYGDYSNEDGWQGANLIREYTSPIADIIGIRHAPPITNGNITTEETMDEQLQLLVDESLKISVSADIHDLKHYPLAQPQVGDRSFLIDERIGLETEVRIQRLRIVKDWQGNVIDLQATFGSPGLVKRHQSNLQTAISNITELIEGRRKLPFSVLDNAVAEATKALQGALTELVVPENGGFLAIDPDNPNHLVAFTSKGIGVSSDGGITFPNAITGLGVNADYIYTGHMLADRIAGGILQSLNGNTEFNLNNGHLRMLNTDFELGGGAKILFANAGNTITYRRTAPLDGIARTSGIGVGLAFDSNYPMAYLGTTGRHDMDVNDWSFTGFIANAHRHILDNDSANAIVGRRLRIVNDSLEWDRGFSFNLSGSRPTLVPINAGNFNYDIGTNDNRIDRMWVRRLRVPSDFLIHNATNSQIGWRMETNYSGDGHGVSLYPTYTGSYNYVIGKTTNKLTNVFSDWFTGSVDSNSSINSKINIESMDGRSAFDYIDMMQIKTYYYQDTDYTNPYEKRVGPIIEQLDPANEHLYKASVGTLDINSNLFLFVQAFKHYKAITDARLEVLENGQTT